MFASTGGGGLNATHMITDSKDIDQTDTVALVPDISGNYNVLKWSSQRAKNSESVPKDWKDSPKHTTSINSARIILTSTNQSLTRNLYDKLPN